MSGLEAGGREGGGVGGAGGPRWPDLQLRLPWWRFPIHSMREEEPLTKVRVQALARWEKEDSPAEHDRNLIMSTCCAPDTGGGDSFPSEAPSPPEPALMRGTAVASPGGRGSAGTLQVAAPLLTVTRREILKGPALAKAPGRLPGPGPEGSSWAEKERARALGVRHLGVGAFLWSLQLPVALPLAVTL